MNPTPSNPTDQLAALRAEIERLAEKERFLRLCQRIASVGSWSMDLQSGRLQTSEETLRILGIPPEAFDGDPETVLGCLHPEDHERARAAVENAVLHGLPHSDEYRVLHPDGTERVIWGQGQLEYDDGLRPLRMVGTILDITRRTLDQQALRTSEHRLRLALSAAQMGTWEWDLRGDLVLSRDIAERLGLVADPPDQDHRSFLERVHPEDRSSLEGWRERAPASRPGAQFHAELRVTGHDGTLHWVACTGSLYDSSAAPRMTGVIREITSERRLEIEVQQTKKLESVARLAGGIAHDFNGLLTVIEASLSTFRAGKPKPEDVQFATEAIQDATDQAARLTGQLLAFARRQVVAPKVLDLNRHVREVTRLLRRTLPATIHLDLDLTSDLWPIKFDPTQLEQVLMNLVGNAQKAMADHGLLRIRTCNLTESERPEEASLSDGDLVLLEVEDTGSGIPEEIRPYIFEPFYSGSEQGTGLGLATCHGILRQNHGHITFRTGEGGTTFQVYLPRCERRTATASETPAPEIHSRSARDILVVDDCEAILGVIGRLLERQGYRTHGARTYRHALRIAREEGRSLDLVITDEVLRDGDGHDLTREVLRQHPQCGVVMMSGLPTEPAAAQRTTLDDVRLLRKPFLPADLLAAVSSAARGGPPERARRRTDPGDRAREAD